MTNEAPVRIGIVGAGLIGRRHIEILEQEPSCQVVGICDPDAAVEGYARGRRISYFNDLESLLQTCRPEGVLVATPNDLHVTQALQSIEAGVPVLVEKPISDTVESALRLAAASEAAEIPVLVGHHRRYNPKVQKARDLVQSGALGQLVAISAVWLLAKPESYFETTWRTQPGGGPTLINLIHDIDSLRFIAGDIAAVQGMNSNRIRGFAVEDTAALIMRLQCGALATVLLSDTAVAPWSWEMTANEKSSYTFPQSGQDCYFIAGTKASLAVPSLRLWHQGGDADWRVALQEQTHAVDDLDPIRQQAVHFADVIRGRATPLITARDACKTLDATLALSRCVASNAEIQLSL